MELILCFLTSVLVNVGNTLMISFTPIDFWNTSDTESEVDLQLSTGGMDQDDDDFDFYG